MATRRWIPTHEITHDNEPTRVMLDDGAAYTYEEFHSGTAADYEANANGEWTFQGQPFTGTVRALPGPTRIPIVTVLIPGRTYNPAELDLVGWTEGDCTGHRGYNVADYFDGSGTYLGPDCHGIEPMVRIPGYDRRPYQIAFCASNGDWDTVERFEAADDAEANAYAERHYDEQEWYVLDEFGNDING